MALLLNRRLDETDDLHILLYVSLLVYIPVGCSCRYHQDDDDISIHVVMGLLLKKYAADDFDWMMMHDDILPCHKLYNVTQHQDDGTRVELKDQKLEYKMHRQQQTYQVDIFVFVCKDSKQVAKEERVKKRKGCKERERGSNKH